MQIDNPLSDEFSGAVGEFGNYDAIPTTQRVQLHKQKHTNIRSFVGDPITRSITMLDLDLLEMGDLNLDTMTTLDGQIVVRDDENWSAGTAAKDSSRHNWWTLSLPCTAGGNPNTSYSVIDPIDISDYAATDLIALALPAFPGASITQAQSYIDFTSNATGDFTIGPTDSIAFSSSSPALPGTNGDAQALFPIAALANVNKAAITGIRFRIQVTGNCTFKISALRAISADWVYAPIDFDTLYERVQFTPSRTGAASEAFGFPTNPDVGMPAGFPIVFRADDSPGLKDPQPVDVTITGNFNTGALTDADGSSDAHTNAFSFYMREVPTDDQIQLELDILTQADLNALGHQPDFGTAQYIGRNMEAMDELSQQALNDESMFNLETLPDTSTHTWIVSTLKWSATGTELTIQNADGVGYLFDVPALIAEGDYAIVLELEGNTIRVRIYVTDASGNIDPSALVIDTGEIIDDTLLKRRKGRVGWWANFADGDAYLNNFRLRDINFGEIVSKSFESNTPVTGVNLFAGSSSDVELFTALQPSPWGVDTLAPDPSASKTGTAFKVVNKGGSPLQGIQTNQFVLENVQYLDLSFDIKFPKSALIANTGLEVFLFDATTERPVPLNFTPLLGDSWQGVKASLQDEFIQPGSYTLVVVQSLADTDTTWWIDNVSIRTPVVTWAGRGSKPDAWRMREDQWVPALNTLNKQFGGIVFEEPGNGLQVRAKALRQSAEIHDYKATPRYAELGRFRWKDEIPALGDSPTATITTSVDALTVTFLGDASSDPDGFIIAHFWSFGDDTYRFGPNVSHIYERAGTYTVVLTVTDNLGNQASTTASVTVS